MYKNNAAILVSSMLFLAAQTQCLAEESTTQQDSREGSQTNSPTKEAVLTQSESTRVRKRLKKHASKKNDRQSKSMLNGILVLPAGKTFAVVLKTFIGADEASPGVEFLARTAESIMLDGAVAIEAGSIIHGKIVESSVPKTLYTSSTISMKCDYITLKGGRIVPVIATVTDRKTVMGKFVAGVGQLVPAVKTIEVYPGAQLVLKLIEDLRLPAQVKQ